MSTDNIVQLVIGAPGIIAMLWLVASFIMQKVSGDEANAAIKPLEVQVVNHEARLIKIESRCDGCTTEKDVRKLTVQLVEMGGDIKAMTVEIRALHDSQSRTEKAVALVNETLMGKS